MRHLLLIPLALALSGCAIGFNPDAFKTDPTLQPLNKRDQVHVYNSCKRARHIQCSINPNNILLIQGRRASAHEGQKFEAETIGNMWCSLNRVQGSHATIVFRWPNGDMSGSKCQETQL